MQTISRRLRAISFLKASLVTFIVGLSPRSALRPCQADPGAAAPQVLVKRLPVGTMQPRVVTQGENVYLVFLTGDPKKSDVFYTASSDGGATFTVPVRVNSIAGSAMAMGTVRGAYVAVGRNRQVHVVWNGSSSTPGFFYSRLRPDGSNFEPQRNLMTHTFGLDGGGAVASDADGRVYAVWHGLDAPGGDEAQRAVFISRSDDDGATFSPEKKVWTEPTGVCGCCQLGLATQPNGKVWLLYRSATDLVHRDTYALYSDDAGRGFRGKKIHEWNINYCPMSTYAVALQDNSLWAAWETAEQIYLSNLRAETNTGDIVAAPGSGKNRKHPALTANGRGQLLLAWTEGTGWARGGALKWQVYGADGKPLSAGAGGADRLPAWDFAAVVPKADGSFVVLF